MKTSFTSFLFMLLALTVVLYGLSFFVFEQLVKIPAMPVLMILGVLFGVTALSHYIVMQANQKSPQVFTRTYMSLSSGRLIVYSIFVFIYCFSHKDIAKQFVITFFVFYIFYTIFEVRAVQSHLKK